MFSKQNSPNFWKKKPKCPNIFSLKVQNIDLKPTFETKKYPQQKQCFEAAYLRENAKHLLLQKVAQNVQKCIPKYAKVVQYIAILGNLMFSKVAKRAKNAQSGHT